MNRTTYVLLCALLALPLLTAAQGDSLEAVLARARDIRETLDSAAPRIQQAYALLAKAVRVEYARKRRGQETTLRARHAADNSPRRESETTALYEKRIAAYEQNLAAFASAWGRASERLVERKRTALEDARVEARRSLGLDELQRELDAIENATYTVQAAIAVGRYDAGRFPVTVTHDLLPTSLTGFLTIPLELAPRAKPHLKSASVAFRMSGGKPAVATAWVTHAGRWPIAIREWKPLQRWAGHPGSVGAVAYSPNGQRIVTSGLDGSARLWDANTDELIRTFQGHTNKGLSVAISPDGRRLVTGSEDKSAKLWGIESGTELRGFQGHTNWVSSVAISPDGRRLVTGSIDDTAKLWDIESGTELRSFQGHADWVFAVAISPDGLRLLTGADDNTAKLWDIESGREMRTFRGYRYAVTPIDLSAGVGAVAFSADSHTIVLASSQGIVEIWRFTARGTDPTAVGGDNGSDSQRTGD